MRPKIYLFGDSITEYAFSNGGWGSSLATHFSRTVDVVLRGYSGYTTRLALVVAKKVLPPPDSGGDPAAVTVFFGANDAAIPGGCHADLHVPLEEYKENLKAIVAFLKEQWPSTRIILITPPPIDEPARLLDPHVNNQTGVPERTNEAAGKYAKQCLAVAEECGVSAIDLWTKMQQFPGWQKAYLSDGLHLTEDGNKFVFEEVIEQLKKNGISVETLPADLPHVTEIDHNDPKSYFEN